VLKKFILKADLPDGVSETHFERWAVKALRLAVCTEPEENPMSRIDKERISVKLKTKGRGR